MIGLIAILASAAYDRATFLDLTLGTSSESWLNGYSLKRTFVLFVIILAVSAIINIFSAHLLARRLIPALAVVLAVSAVLIVLIQPQTRSGLLLELAPDADRE